jgi:hypothetical protein
MPSFRTLLSAFRNGFKSQGTWLARPFGLDLLTAPQTQALLAPAALTARPAESLLLPASPFFADGNEGQFDEAPVQTAHTSVWRCESPRRKARLLRSGGIRLGSRVLHTDFGTAAVLKEMLRPDRRERVEADTLIAPWSHYWSSFYDYVFFVAAKLCRMKDALPPAVFDQAVVAYPLLDTPFEAEILALLGFGPDRIRDSRTTEVRFRSVVLGNTASWFYPHPADVEALRRHLGARLAGSPAPARRIYVSRAGRRIVRNEEALVALLERYGFVFVEDRPRSLAEQYALFHNASFIIGPHGSAFANLLWCQPGTQLLELFAANYLPEYFRYLAELSGVRYAAYCAGPLRDSHHSYVDADLDVDLGEFEFYLNRLLESH